MTIRAYAADAPRTPLRPFEFDPGPLADEWVEVAVEHCGICHSDLSMIDNDWGQTTYPIVAGHEVVGRVVAVGTGAKRVKVGDLVGVGWFASSCTECNTCLGGSQNLCADVTGLITHHRGGFAERVRAHWLWTTPLPDNLDASTAGPLLCGGITVFGPIANFGVRPTDRVGVVGIGGLGHLAVQFLRAWGCEVTAFTSTASKRTEALNLGAHKVVASNDPAALKPLAGQFDFVLVTANVPLSWNDYLAALAPRGRLHIVGAVLEPIPVPAFALIGGEKQLSGSPLGSPATITDMLEFCARHQIAPQVERFPFRQINDALDHLRAGRARWRIVLDADWDH
ncbi:MAG: NAD(P)-dependent alcohol dehydrogenase [Thioalkalivibrionaceae bacterium]